MAYLTFNHLSSNVKTFSTPKILNESIKASSYLDKRVFLSYRHKDRSHVAGVIKFLKDVGINIYIDFLDETLENQTNDKVAQQLRDRIKESDKFISLATPNSGESKWMPWELGLGDRIINYKNVAILPLSNNENIWSDQEYGKIYGRIESKYRLSISDESDWKVIYPNGTNIELKDWLKQ